MIELNANRIKNNILHKDRMIGPPIMKCKKIIK